MQPYLKYIFLILPFVALTTLAQKLPKIQTKNALAPPNIKIDGKLTEWEDKFQAYNSGQHIKYTISNDENNLYFIVQMDGIIGTRKVFRGGIDFSIVPASNQSPKITINFPVISQKRNGVLEDQDGGPFFNYNKLQKNAVANKEKMEALVLLANKQLIKDYKYIYTTGIPIITDTLISVYNTQGIMVAGGFDKNMRYTYELAIPLKFLPTADNSKTLKYNIKLRTLPIMFIKPITAPSAGPVITLRYVGPASISDEFLFNDTDFSGAYTLTPTQ